MKIKKVYLTSVFVLCLFCLSISIGYSITVFSPGDLDGDGYNSSIDCNDNDASIYPGAAENFSNFKDDDCDGWINSVNYSVRSKHPRILITPDNIENIRNTALGNQSAMLTKMTSIINPLITGSVSSYKYHIIDIAMAFVLTGNETYLNATRNILLQSNVSSEEDRISRAAAFDWIYNNLTPSERTTILQGLVSGVDKSFYSWSNITYYFPVDQADHMVAAKALTAYAAYGEGVADQNMSDLMSNLKSWLEWSVNVTDEVETDWAECPGYTDAEERMPLLIEGFKTTTGEDYWNRTTYWDNFSSSYFYATDPSNNLLPPRGDTGWHVRHGFFRALYSGELLAKIYRNLYLQEEINDYLSSYLSGGNASLFHWGRSIGYHFIFYDPALQESDPATLPLDARFGPEKLDNIYMRSSRTEQNTTYVAFFGGDFFLGHDGHGDSLSFYLSKYAPLALDTIYYGGMMSSQMDSYYNKQTIAHNAVVVYKPGEFSPNHGGQKTEGLTEYSLGYGQRRTDASDVIKYESRPEYVYILGNSTKAYSSTKLNLSEREFIFIRPDYFVIADRINSLNSSYTKNWLLHSAYEPQIDGQSISNGPGYVSYNGTIATITNSPGKLFLKSVSPPSILRKRGGFVRTQLSHSVATNDTYCTPPAGYTSCIDVNSTAGFPNSGLVIITRDAGEAIDFDEAIKYGAKTENKLLNLTRNYTTFSPKHNSTDHDAGVNVTQGFEFWVPRDNNVSIDPNDGDNYPHTPTTHIDYGYQAIPYGQSGGAYPQGGAWRIEVEPQVQNKYDFFLNVIEAAHENKTSMVSVDAINATNNATGVFINESFFVLMSNTTDKINHTTYALNTTNPINHLIVDLHDNTVYRIYDNNALTYSVTSSNQGTLWFNTTKGNSHTYTITTEAVIPGDLNGDGKVSIADIQTCIKVILGTETGTDIVARADVNKDSKVSIKDIQEIIRIILGG